MTAIFIPYVSINFENFRQPLNFGIQDGCMCWLRGRSNYVKKGDKVDPD